LGRSIGWYSSRGLNTSCVGITDTFIDEVERIAELVGVRVTRSIVTVVIRRISA